MGVALTSDVYVALLLRCLECRAQKENMRSYKPVNQITSETPALCVCVCMCLWEVLNIKKYLKSALTDPFQFNALQMCGCWVACFLEVLLSTNSRVH